MTTEYKDLVNRTAVKKLRLAAAHGQAVGSDVVAEARAIDKGIITQDGVARVFADRFADRLRYCHNTGSWYQWVGTHWGRDETAIAFHFVRELGRELSELSEKADLKEVRRVSFAGGVERYCRSDPAFAVISSQWDRDQFLLGTPGGTVDLRTGLLREPDPADGITKLTAVAPDENADCPLWMKFLKETFGDDEPLIRFLQQWAGYNLTGDIREHALLFGSGKGGNGKGVWLNVQTKILKDYATTATMESLTASAQEPA